MPRENEIRCIALDLDGTTLNSQGRLSERNKKAIERALEHNIHVMIASGRPLASLPEEVVRIEGIQYAVTSNGAAVCDLESGRTLREYRLTQKSVEEILSVTREMDVAYEVLMGGSSLRPGFLCERSGQVWSCGQSCLLYPADTKTGGRHTQLHHRTHR